MIMAVLSDTQIKERALNGMITPFVDKLITQDKQVKVLSYGLSSYGYDIRLSPSQCLLLVGYSTASVILRTLTQTF